MYFPIFAPSIIPREDKRNYHKLISKSKNIPEWIQERQTHTVARLGDKMRCSKMSFCLTDDTRKKASDTVARQYVFLGVNRQLLPGAALGPGASRSRDKIAPNRTPPSAVCRPCRVSELPCTLGKPLTRNPRFRVDRRKLQRRVK